MSKKAVARVAAIALAAAAAASGASAQSFTVFAQGNSTVYDNTSYPTTPAIGPLNTGIMLNVGDVLNITASGTWLGDPSLSAPNNTANGSFIWGDFDGLPKFSLVGIIGMPGLNADPAVNALNSFLIGTSFSSTVTTAGTLYLAFLDSDFSNNTGFVNANVSVTPVPEPGTYALMLAGLGVVGWMARRKKAEGERAAEPQGAAA